ncbi:MAG: aminotransferase class I/II-fold pyridoxal phosphate-dependent enzyme [Candidatus Omnitrophica bacterium]|nr:aminotransferase class I/II-fold pyridoxal phosphate-dependent enzyme [Candidatus Omnitrophota bacterium]
MIDFGVGDPDFSTPDFVIRSMTKHIQSDGTHHYPLDRGNAVFRRTIAEWAKARFGTVFDPDTEVLPLIGSKEGIAHFPLAFINPGDVALVPDPCYPPYRSGTQFAGGEVYDLPLSEEKGFLPDLEAVPGDVLKKTKLITVNYPNNPTGAAAPRSFYEGLVAWALKNRVFIVSDMAYSEVYLEKAKPLSIFEIPGAKDIAVEFHSLSKTCNMTGWRVGFALGPRPAIEALLKVKSNVDSGVFTAIQLTAADALKKSFAFSKKNNGIYRRRRDLLVSGLQKMGFPVKPNPATFYVFTQLPEGRKDSTQFCKTLLEKAGIVAAPGVGFGPAAEGYIRFALTVDERGIREALRRLRKGF